MICAWASPLRACAQNLNEIVRTLRARGIEVLVIGFGAPLDFAGLALRHDALYTNWGLPLGQYRARDGSHYNATGYGILVARMLPEVEVLVKRVASR